jgi:hypothetical protein
MDLKETVSECEDWMQRKGKIRGRWLSPVHLVMNLRLTMKGGEFLTSSATIGFSRRTQLRGVRLLKFQPVNANILIVRGHVMRKSCRS